MNPGLRGAFRRLPGWRKFRIGVRLVRGDLGLILILEEVVLRGFESGQLGFDDVVVELHQDAVPFFDLLPFHDGFAGSVGLRTRWRRGLPLAT